MEYGHKKLMIWHEQLEHILEQYREVQGIPADDPLDGDEVEHLCHILKAKLNLIEGNITEEEYLESPPYDAWVKLHHNYIKKGGDKV